jgi:TusA-related sulfurtransferase
MKFIPKLKEDIERLSKLTGKHVVLSEAEEAKPTTLPNQANSMAQLNDRFKAKEFVPTKEIFHVGRFKYEFKKAKPESVDFISLTSSSREKLEVVYTCKEAKSTITFTYNIGGGLVQPSKVTLEK